MTGSGSLTLRGRRPDRQYLRHHQRRHVGRLASGELIVITPANLTIGSVIANNGGATGLTKAGSATLTLRQQYLQRRDHGRCRRAADGQRRQRRFDWRHQQRAGQREPRLQPQRQRDVL